MLVIYVHQWWKKVALQLHFNCILTEDHVSHLLWSKSTKKIISHEPLFLIFDLRTLKNILWLLKGVRFLAWVFLTPTFSKDQNVVLVKLLSLIKSYKLVIFTIFWIDLCSCLFLESTKELVKKYFWFLYISFNI